MNTLRSAVLLAILVSTTFLSGCTENARAKNNGGTMTIDLPPGQKLVVATWKEGNLWYLTRPLRQGEILEISTFKEKSNLGILEGTVIFREHPSK